MDSILLFYFLRANPKSRLFQNVINVPIFGIPNILAIADILNSKNKHYFQKNAICVFPEVLHIFVTDRFFKFQIFGPLLQHTDFWNSHIPHTHLLCLFVQLCIFLDSLNNQTFTHSARYG